jgi:hypothetical protein
MDERSRPRRWPKRSRAPLPRTLSARSRPTRGVPNIKTTALLKEAASRRRRRLPPRTPRANSERCPFASSTATMQTRSRVFPLISASRIPESNQEGRVRVA